MPQCSRRGTATSTSLCASTRPKRAGSGSTCTCARCSCCMRSTRSGRATAGISATSRSATRAADEDEEDEDEEDEEDGDDEDGEEASAVRSLWVFESFAVTRCGATDKVALEQPGRASVTGR
eukprot:736958-Rhodomonas_salina.1